MKKLLILLLIAHCLSPVIHSQAPQNWTSADMYLALRKLNVLGTVLYVAAHPDDENTRLITYLSKDRLYRTGYLSMTRGDGGQNLIGDEQGIELGLIRTQELLSARRMDGGEQFFSRAYDFGYSKSPEETFTKWDREKILSDVVWVIRKFQPDVIITRFPTTGEGGHGHHTASAVLANEAFTAAADPKRFPEQLALGVQPWQAKRICWNGFNFGGGSTPGADLYRVDVGGYNPLLGKSYGEIAAESRSQHKSQGFGNAATRGESMESFRTTGGQAPVNDLMDGVDQTWKRVKGGDAVSKMIDKLISSFDLLHPDASVPGLVSLYKTMRSLPDSYWKEQKLKEVQRLIEQCSGLFIDVTTGQQFAVQTDSIRINFILNNRLGTTATVKSIRVDAYDSVLNQVLAKNKNLLFSRTFYVPASKPVTQPYWLENKMELGYFNVNNQQKIGQPDVDAAYVANITINIDGEDFNFERSVKYRFTDPVKGEIYSPLAVIPSYTLKIIPELSINPRDKNNEYVNNYEKQYTSYRPGNNIMSGFIGQNGSYANEDSLVLNKDVRSVSEKQAFHAGTLMNSSKLSQAEPLYVNDAREFVNMKTKDKLRDMTVIKYDHIPTIIYFKPTIAETKIFPLSIYNKKIGYIIGAGDKVPEALEQMGYEVTLLTDKELSRNNLSQFDAIITGVRAYNTNDWMNKHYEKLMKYVSEGGNLIVQYNTSNNIGPVRARIGPYNFNISRTRVTDENATMNILKPEHPVLNFPNKIGPDDFKGWIQERSIYHASDWDKEKFETIFSMNDPGEKTDEGSLIVAKYGQGYFTYTGIVFFRELPAGVPGAYRLMANIIALNRKKGF